MTLVSLPGLDWRAQKAGWFEALDRAGVVIEAVDGPGQLLSWDLDADGTAQPYLYADIGDYLRMDGREVFRRAVRIMVDSATKALTAAGVGAEDIALLVPHQANIRIIDAACQRLGIPIERTATNIDRFGNTTAGTIPLALNEAAEGGRLAPGNLVLLAAVGAGFTVGAVLVRWG